MKLIVKPLTKTASLPIYGDDYAAGADVRSDEDCVVEAGKRKCISTGISAEWCKSHENDENPKKYYLKLCPRSGLAYNHGIDLFAGIIDFNYRGEIKVILFNSGEKDFVIERGDRICQAILTRIEKFDEIVLSNELSNTERGEGGFGSTGVK